MDKQGQRVAVCILTYNSCDIIQACIDSVLRQTYSNFDLLVLDNASKDCTASLINEKYPQLSLKVLPTNIGFARAHNFGIREMKAFFYMPLNPDVVLEPTYIEEMVKAINSNDQVGIAAGKLLFLDANFQKTNVIYSTGHLLTKSRSPSNRGYKEHDRGQYEQVEEVFTANGAAPLYKKSMLEDVCLNDEFFCEDFFLYGEDHDLGWRARLRGWKCIYTPFAVGYHQGYGSGGIKSFKIAVQFTRNRYLTLARNDRFSDFILDLPFILLYETLWQAAYLFHSPKRLKAHWIGIYQAFHDARKMQMSRHQIQSQKLESPETIRNFFVNRLW